MTDKRSLRNGYKQSFVPIGVYAIRNTVNQRVYVGGSRNLEGAMNRHRFELATGAHRNAALLADWKRYGADAFRFEVLDQVRQSTDPDVDYDAELATLLELWQHELPCFGPGGYNGPERPLTRR
ncbi:MAG: GIY-YIG nuclease family protein [Rhodoferax sp.]|nr:GIY-YIG nuclease family protein [Rhodoferax sp.]